MRNYEEVNEALDQQAEWLETLSGLRSSLTRRVEVLERIAGVDRVAAFKHTDGECRPGGKCEACNPLIFVTENFKYAEMNTAEAYIQPPCGRCGGKFPPDSVHICVVSPPEPPKKKLSYGAILMRWFRNRGWGL